VSPDWIIRLHGLAAGYRGQTVLRDVDFTLLRGSFTALLGANGSGKSTLLKTILGLVPSLAGQIEFRHIASPTIGYVPQHERLDGNYPLAALDVVMMGAHLRIAAGFAVPASERAAARECLRATGVEDLAGQRFARLSGGQKQRVLIARALMTRPDILVLDEPTSGVDASATAAILELLAGIHRERQLTILLVTHDLGIVRRHANRVAWLRHGRLTEGETAVLMTPEHIAEMLELA
jgi:manganese/zinc/iron transport system ATP- binding protein